MGLKFVAMAAAVGGIIGFAASQMSNNTPEAVDGAATAALIDARVNARLEELGLTSKTELEGRISGGVASYLAEQPEAVYNALALHQQNEKAREEDARRQTVAQLGDALFDQEGDPSFGASAETADMTLVEFFDYRCGYCKRSLQTVLDLVESDPKLRVVLKEFPILGPESVVASRVSLAANRIDPKLHKGFHTALMAHRGGFDTTSLLIVAAAAGYDPAAVQAEMEASEVTTQIRNAYEVAEALGIRGTPAFVVGDTVIPGAVNADQLRQAIEKARAKDKG